MSENPQDDFLADPHYDAAAAWAAGDDEAPHPAPRCPVCRDTLLVLCEERDGTGMYHTACPESVHTTTETDAAVAAMMRRDVCGHEHEGREIALDPAGEEPY